jgi:hypothetical protein
MKIDVHVHSTHTTWINLTDASSNLTVSTIGCIVSVLSLGIKIGTQNEIIPSSSS